MGWSSSSSSLWKSPYLGDPGGILTIFRPTIYRKWLSPPAQRRVPRCPTRSRRWPTRCLPWECLGSLEDWSRYWRYGSYPFIELKDIHDEVSKIWRFKWISSINEWSWKPLSAGEISDCLLVTSPIPPSQENQKIHYTPPASGCAESVWAPQPWPWLLYLLRCGCYANRWLWASVPSETMMDRCHKVNKHRPLRLSCCELWSELPQIDSAERGGSHSSSRSSPQKKSTPWTPRAKAQREQTTPWRREAKAPRPHQRCKQPSEKPTNTAKRKPRGKDPNKPSQTPRGSPRRKGNLKGSASGQDQ